MALNIDVMRGKRAKKKRFSLTIILSMLIVVGIAALMLTGDILAPQDPAAQNPGLSAVGPTSEHWLGTDQLGRDVFSRLIVGARLALVGPIFVAIGAIVIGAALGLVAGYYGGKIDSIISRAADLMYSMPSLLIAIIVIGIVGGDYWMTVAVLTLLTFPGVVRITRSVSQIESRLVYVDAARALGVRDSKIMTKHILPNIMPTVVATFMLELVWALVSFVALAFLGIGVEPGSTDWGNMLADGRDVIFQNPAMPIGAGLLVIIAAVSMTNVGDWMYARLSSGGQSR